MKLMDEEDHGKCEYEMKKKENIKFLIVFGFFFTSVIYIWYGVLSSISWRISAQNVSELKWNEVK